MKFEIFLSFLKLSLPSLIRTIVFVVTLCVIGKKLYKAFSKNNKATFGSKLLALIVADAISRALVIVVNEIINFVLYKSFYTPALGIYLIPIVGRLISIKSIPSYISTISYFSKELISDIRSYYGYVLVDSVFAYLPTIIAFILNIFEIVFFVIYMLVFLFKKRPEDIQRQETIEEVKVQQTVENVVEQNPTVNKTVQTKKYKNINDEFVIEELKKYKQLLDAGVLTQEEFDIKKKQLLGL